MISRLFTLSRQSFALRQHFATATLTEVNYYNILGIESGATAQQIHSAYTQKVRSINPALDEPTFRSLSQAFVILTNNKARDAYDSLLRARQVTYISETEEIRPQSRSYLAQRRQQSNRLIRKKMNIDQLGRYKGGLPQNLPPTVAQQRKGAANKPGQLATRIDIESYSDRFPEYNIVDSEVAESFKNYHQTDRRDRTMKEPWFNLQVDYDFFTFKTFRQQYLPWLRWLAVLGFAVPVGWVFIDRQVRLWEQKAHKGEVVKKKAH